MMSTHRFPQGLIANTSMIPRLQCAPGKTWQIAASHPRHAHVFFFSFFLSFFSLSPYGLWGPQFQGQIQPSTSARMRAKKGKTTKLNAGRRAYVLLEIRSKQTNQEMKHMRPSRTTIRRCSVSKNYISQWRARAATNDAQLFMYRLSSLSISRSARIGRWPASQPASTTALSDSMSGSLPRHPVARRYGMRTTR